jgi:hypothetical protein
MKHIYFFFQKLKIDHPIHPPATEGDPFDIEIVPNLNCKMIFKNGVINVFKSDDSPFSNFVYPELKMFVDDYHLLVNLIGNGPL